MPNLEYKVCGGEKLRSEENIIGFAYAQKKTLSFVPKTGREKERERDVRLCI